MPFDFLRRHWILSAVGVFLLLLLVLLLLQRRGPHHSYTLNLLLPKDAQAKPGQLQVGVAKRDIAPVLEQYDDWQDLDNNGRWDKDTDTFTDRNGNGRFDGCWLAGFNSSRPAKGIHDSPWVRALALRNNGVTVVLVSVDSIGIFHNEFVTIRKMLDPALNIDHVMFSSTHCHEVPDTMKIWSGPVPVWGYQQQYMDLLQEMAKQAIEEAVQKLQPADVVCATTEVPIDGFIDDSRKPQVIDQTMYLMRFTKPHTEDTIATFVNWGNHPETLGGSNNLVTSDYPNWLRLGMENGVPAPNGAEGFGGMCLFFEGQIGGLMTQLHTTVPHRDGKQEFHEASFEKAESLGYNLALLGLEALRGPGAWKNDEPLVAVAAKTIKLPLHGLFKYGIMLGLIHEGYYLGGYAKTEVDVIRLGNVMMLAVPCEIYPEIVEGGVEALPGRDYDVPPQEVPPLREVMEPGPKMALVVGLANDEIGYIVPKSQWDTKPPFIYDGKDQYGEENSPGPEVGPLLHKACKELIEEMHAAHAW